MVRGACGFASAVIGGSLKADPVKLSARGLVAVSEVLREAQESAWWTIPTLLLVIPAAEFLRRQLGDPQRWRNVRSVLDGFRDTVFKNADGAQVHEHRVTLFKYVSWAACARCWPWSGWLIPVARSGHTTQKSTVVFKAPDEADAAEGVAGMTWSRRQVVSVQGLPNVSASPTPDQIHAYALQSFISGRVVGKRKPRSRALLGFPVEVKGELWGVIVIDSRGQSIDATKARRAFKTIKPQLPLALEGL